DTTMCPGLNVGLGRHVHIRTREAAMEQFLLITLNGLSLAGVYFLVASGLTLIFGLMRVITMAHGTMYLLGGYIGYVIARETGQWWLALLGAAAVVGLLGLLIHQVLIQRFQ